MIRIFDIPIHSGAPSEIVEEIARGCSDTGTETCRCISASGAHGLVEARREPSFSHVLQSFFVNLPDGVPVVWLGRLKGAREMKRCYGPDLFRDVLIKTAAMPIKHFFCGGKEGRAAELRHVAEERFGNTN